jgi:hypothetical protein
MSDEIESSIAELAQLVAPEESRERFRELLRIIIEEARVVCDGHDPDSLPLRVSDVAHSLKPVLDAAQKLDSALATVRGEGKNLGRRGAAAIAGSLLEMALRDACIGEVATNGYLPVLAAWRQALGSLITAALEAEGRAPLICVRDKRGRPTTDIPFRIFVARLHEIARMTGVKWTHYRDQTSPDGPEWKGNLMLAFDILRPHLPRNGFSLNVSLGRRLEYLREQMRDDTTEIRPSPV